MQFNNNAVILDPKKVPEPCHTFEMKETGDQNLFETKKNRQMTEALKHKQTHKNLKHKLDIKPIIHIVESIPSKLIIQIFSI